MPQLQTNLYVYIASFGLSTVIEEKSLKCVSVKLTKNNNRQTQFLCVYLLYRLQSSYQNSYLPLDLYSETPAFTNSSWHCSSSVSVLVLVKL